VLYDHHNPRSIFIRLLASLLCCAAVLCLSAFFLQKKHDKTFAALQYDAETVVEIDALKESGKPTIVIFGADYCPTCLAYQSHITLFASLYGDEITIRYVNTEKHTPVRKCYNIERIPGTLFFDKEGKPWIPADSVKMDKNAYLVPKRAHISETWTPNLGGDLGENPCFEFGTDAEGNITYCKYTGLITYAQLSKIAKILLK